MNDTILLFTESGLHMESALCKYECPASGAPVQIKELLATGRPRSSIGVFFECEARRRSMFHFKSSGASAMKSLQHSRNPRISDSGANPSANTTDFSGWS